MEGVYTKKVLAISVCCLMAIAVLLVGCGDRGIDGDNKGNESKPEGSTLPVPDTEGGMSLDEALRKRRSVRSFSEKKLSEEQVSRLLWAAQGVTQESTGFRTAPSAGATYPLEVYVLENGKLCHYLPGSNSVEVAASGIDEQQLVRDALGQTFVGRAPVVFIIAADFERTRMRYGPRGDRYVYIEVGHAAENLLLEAVALGLGAVPVGAFDDDGVSRTLGFPPDLAPVYLIPVGYPPGS